MRTVDTGVHWRCTASGYVILRLLVAYLTDLDLTPNTLYSQQPGPTFSSAMQDQAHQDADEHLEQYLIPINTGPDDENNAAPKPGVNLETLFSDSFEGFSWDGFGTDMAFNTDIPTM